MITSLSDIFLKYCIYKKIFLNSLVALFEINSYNFLKYFLGGLSLTVQFLAQISSCADVIYPKRLSIHDFALNPPSNDYQFIKKWSKLNLNVAYLCLSQQLDLDLVEPCEALKNLSSFVENVLTNGCLINR